MVKMTVLLSVAFGVGVQPSCELLVEFVAVMLVLEARDEVGAVRGYLGTHLNRRKGFFY